jgi:tetratricopeptide (TPR) repeat protein
MSLFYTSQVLPPKNWQEFEELCTDLWAEIFKSNNTQMHGRTGQSQYGVDVYGQIDNSLEWFGVQCKGKDSRYGNAVTEKELRSEVEKAKEFTPKLSVFILATTAQNDAKIQQLARYLTEENQKIGFFKIEVKSWDEIHREISKYPVIIYKYYPHLSSLDVNRAPPIEPQLQLMAPPRASKHFFGRQDELSTLINALQSESSILISGIGGIGKSEFLLQALKQLETDKTVIWCSIDKYHSVESLTLALRQVFAVQGVPCSTDNLPLHFDKIKAFIVFDGLEQSNLDNLEELEELEDLIKKWHFATKITQFVMTSQVTLYSFPGQTTIQLKGLDEVASRSLFNQSYGDDSLVKDKGIDDLLQFCDGHALAITISSALTKHYGNAVNALKFINKKTTQHLGLPERRRHNRHTSLEICLQIAYDSLPENTRQLLWALSETPAGVATGYFDNEWLKIKDTREAYASLKRWHFVDEIIINEKITETRVLTPIRKFVVERVKQEDPESYERIIKLLALRLHIQVAAIEKTYDSAEDTPHLMSRYNAILPNLLNIIELALARESDKDLGNIACSLATAIMPYYFVSGAPEVGAKVLKTVTELALKTNNIEEANDLVQQFMSLAKRADHKALLTEGLGLVKSIELAADGLDIAPELSMSKAIAANHDSLTEQHARVAITGFENRLQKRLKKLQEDKIEDDELIFKLEPLLNEIAISFGVLGTALLNQNKPDKAAKAYHQTLRHQRGSSSGVNQGQTLHQIGRCESKLANYKSAIEHFSEAAEIFFYIGMKDYLSHSFAEIGYNLLDVDLPELQKQFTEECVSAALVDLMQYTIREFDTSLPFEYQEYMYDCRKLTGTFYFLSLIGHGEKLGAFVHDLAEKTMFPLIKQFESGKRESSDRILIKILSLILNLGKHIELVEIDFAEKGDVEHETVWALLTFICEIDSWMHDGMRMTDWLAVYFTRRLSFKGIDSHRLKEFIWNYNNDVEDNIDLER